MSLFSVVLALEEVILRSASGPQVDSLSTATHSVSPLEAGGHFWDLLLRSVPQSFL